MKKINNKKTIIIISFFFIFALIGIFINNAFFKPTKLNAFIAAKIYSSPANKDFTDDDFYQCVINAYNSNLSSSQAVDYTTNLTDGQLKTITKLSCNSSELGTRWYNNIDGIEKLTSLEELSLNHNDLYEINLSYFPKLKRLSLINNNLNDIDLTSNSELTYLNLSSNFLTELDISNNLKLQDLQIGNGYRKRTNDYDPIEGNSIQNIDLTGHTLLEEFSATWNALTTINLSNNKKLTSINLQGNQLTTINLENNKELTSLGLADNYLTDIDLSYNTKLKYLTLTNNQISNIDVANLTELESMNMNGNKLERIDLSENIKLLELRLDDNNLSNIDLDNLSLLHQLNIKNNKLTELDISKTSMQTLNAGDNKISNFIPNNKLVSLAIHNNELNTIDVSKNTNLKELFLTHSPNDLYQRIWSNDSQDDSKIINFQNLLKRTCAFNSIDLTSNTRLTKFSACFYEKVATYFTEKDIFLNNKANKWNYEKGKSSPILGPYGHLLPGNKTRYIASDLISDTHIYGHEIYSHEFESMSNIQEFGVYNFVDLYALSLTSSKYNIDNENFTVDILNDKISEDILNNLSLNYGELKIKGNKLQLTFEGEIVKEFNLISSYKDKVNINNYKISNSINNEEKWFKGYNGNINFDITSEDIENLYNFDVKVYKGSDEDSKFKIMKTNESNKLKIVISNGETDSNSFALGNYEIRIYNGNELLKTKEFKIEDPILVSEININDIVLNLDSESVTLDYSIEPNNATNKNVTIEINEASIAQLEESNTKIKPLKIGKTTITLTAQDDGHRTKTVNLEVKDFGITTNEFIVDYNKKIIRHITENMTSNDFINKFTKKDSSTLKVYNDTNELNTDDKIKTNFKLKYVNGETQEEYTIVIDGDVSCDGKVLANDILAIKMHILNKSTLEDIKFISGDINEDNLVNAIDIMYIKRYILHKSNNVWG